MAVKRPFLSSVAPWSGLIAGMLGEAVHHQLLSDMLHFDCRRGGALPGLALGVGVVALMCVGAWVSWASCAHARTGHPQPDTRRFIARMSIMAAALFAIAVVWQTLAGFIVPACPT